VVSLPAWLRPWPCTHHRGPRPWSGPGSRYDARPSCLLPVPPPVRFFAPPTLSVRGIHFPGVTFLPRPPRLDLRRSCSSVAFQPRLVAGFHTRSGPPSPFLATLTVYPSPNPVISFNHSRPWGSFPCSPHRLHVRAVPKNRPSKHGGWGSEQKPPGWAGGLRARCPGSAEALPVRRGFPDPPKRSRSAFGSPPAPKCRRVAAASLLLCPPLRPPRWPVRLRLPSPFVLLVVCHPALGCRAASSSSPSFRSLGGFSAPGCPGSVAPAASCRDPSSTTPSQGVPLPFVPDRRLGVSTANARVPIGNGPSGLLRSTRLRSRPWPLSRSRPFASAD
jgi:hypothetical protein